LLILITIKSVKAKDEMAFTNPTTIDVLLIEDHEKQARLVAAALDGEPIRLHHASTVGAARELMARLQPPVVISDIGLPGPVSGQVLCQELKAQNPSLQILLLTGFHQTYDKIQGLEGGADDYLTKPYDPLELRARVRVLLRRAKLLQRHYLTAQSLVLGKLQLNPQSRQAHVAQVLLDLRRREFDLLLYLAQRAGQVCQRAELLRALSQQEPESERSIDTYVRRLRAKLDAAAPQSSQCLETLRGLGYRLNPEKL